MLSALAALAVLAGCSGTSSGQAAKARSYKTATAAVEAACHPARIMYPRIREVFPMPGVVEVGWQTAGEAPGEGWAARVSRTAGRFTVVNCRAGQVIHG